MGAVGQRWMDVFLLKLYCYGWLCSGGCVVMDGYALSEWSDYGWLCSVGMELLWMGLFGGNVVVMDGYVRWEWSCYGWVCSVGM